MWRTGPFPFAALEQCGHVSRSLTWMVTPACPSKTGAAQFHQTRAPPAWAATCPAHHSAHCAACAPTTPIDDAPAEWLASTGATSVRRRLRVDALPGHTGARNERGASADAGSDARTRDRAAPSQPRRRRCARNARAIAAPSSAAMKHPARGRSNAGRGDMARRRQAISASMRIAEARGSTRRRENPLNAPRPGRSLPGHVRRRGRGRTSKVSSPRRIVAPGPSARPSRAGSGTRRRDTRRIEEEPTERRTAFPFVVEKIACSRAMLALDNGMSPARPTTPGARASPTSGPSTQARCRSVRRAARARGNRDRSWNNDQTAPGREQTLRRTLWTVACGKRSLWTTERAVPVWIRTPRRV